MSPKVEDFKYLSLQVIEKYNSDQKIKNKFSLGEEKFFGSNLLSISSSSGSIGLVEADVSVINPRQFQQFIENLVDFLREEYWSETGVSDWPKCQFSQHTHPSCLYWDSNYTAHWECPLIEQDVQGF